MAVKDHTEHILKFIGKLVVVHALKETLMKFVVQKKSLMAESDVIHALIKYHLKNLKAEEVIKYRQEILGKDE